MLGDTSISLAWVVGIDDTGITVRLPGGDVSASFPDSAHLLLSRYRVWEMYEKGRAMHEVESVVLKWQAVSGIVVMEAAPGKGIFVFARIQIS